MKECIIKHSRERNAIRQGIAAGTFVILLTLVSRIAIGVDLVSLVRTAKPAVVQLRCYDENHHLLKTGTGFFVTSDGVLVTNHHVIAGASYLEARTPTGAFYPFTGKHVQVGD